MSELGELSADRGGTEFSHIPDWYEWERGNVRREVEAGTYSTGPLPVHVDSLPNARRFIPLGEGTLVHDMNGFTVREVIAYIARETVVTNLLGILLGLGAGMFLGYRVICLMEGLTTHFVHRVQPLALVGGAVITAGFSVILNVIALRKVKYLKLTDVA